MRKIDVIGNVLIVLGILAIAGGLLAFLWPLWLAIASLFVASRLISFFNDKKEVITKKISQIAASLRLQPQPVHGELIDSPTATTTAVSQTP